MKPINQNSLSRGVKTLILAVTLSGMMTGIALADVDVADGNAAHGEKVFKKCQACHTIEKDGPDRVGPNLYGIMERGVATKEGYNYSKAMKEFGAKTPKWTEEVLFQYLEKPRALVPGTFMTFAGLKKPQDRDDLLSYLEKASGHDD
ncbi:MAG: cytochrome c family protein [Parvibaculum sp.]